MRGRGRRACAPAAVAALAAQLAAGQTPECPSGMQIRPAQARGQANGRITVQFNAFCNGQALANGFQGALCSADGSYQLLDGGQVVSSDEAKWCVRNTVAETDILALVLVDTSNSISSRQSVSRCGGVGCLELVQQAVNEFIRILRDNVPGDGVNGNDLGIDMKIGAFDGRAGTQTIQDWSQNSAQLMQSVNQLNCGTTFCQDPSTNLHGALAEGSRMLADRAQGRNVQAAFLIFFTDGTDQSARLTEDQARAAIANPTTSQGLASGLPPLEVHGVGVVGEDANANTGICQACFERLTLDRPNHVHSAATMTALTAEFAATARAVALIAQSFYAVDYCTPRRGGTRNQLTLRFGQSQWLLGAYDATGLGQQSDGGGGSGFRACEAEICPCTPAPTMACPAPCIHPVTRTQLGPAVPGFPPNPGGGFTSPVTPTTPFTPPTPSSQAVVQTSARGTTENSIGVALSGLTVSSVDPAGSAAAAGVQPGWVLESVNGMALSDASQLPGAYARSPSQVTAVLRAQPSPGVTPTTSGNPYSPGTGTRGGDCSSSDDTWKTIAIIFIILTVLLLIAAIALGAMLASKGGKKGDKQREDKQAGGYPPPADQDLGYGYPPPPGSQGYKYSNAPSQMHYDGYSLPQDHPSQQMSAYPQSGYPQS
eukprot:TRINITY_DN64864_c0_g1_i1.p1 TRINITY_DN64864_c0_g1~~TRINITY_DN64864_c0_g1_i1.p1  ORF type:complete len:654 (+),score=178.66 TRINITY_DN64864_c0_g1_i1:81-2042(+)